jgi:hypothetical protein
MANISEEWHSPDVGTTAFILNLWEENLQALEQK